MLDIYEIKKYLKGKTNQDEFLIEVKKAIADIRDRSKSLGSFTKSEGIETITLDDYLLSANYNIQNLRDTSEEDSKVLIEAIICDMCNNMAHAEELIKGDNRKRKTALFSMKTSLIKEIAKECEKEGNECYGKLYDSEKDCESFFVDIPMHGQISWHLGKNNFLKCKDYPYIKHNTVYRNCDFLSYNGIQKSADLPEHINVVMKSFDNAEMVNGLSSIGKVKSTNEEIIIQKNKDDVGSDDQER